jgi:hypothetical protein
MAWLEDGYVTTELRVHQNFRDDMFHQHVTQNNSMIVHGVISCTGGVMTSDTEWRQ